MKLCTKNYENRSIFVEVTANKSVAPFSGHGVYLGSYVNWFCLCVFARVAYVESVKGSC